MRFTRVIGKDLYMYGLTERWRQLLFCVDRMTMLLVEVVDFLHQARSLVLLLQQRVVLLIINCAPALGGGQCSFDRVAHLRCVISVIFRLSELPSNFK